MCILTYMLSNELYQSVTINKTKPILVFLKNGKFSVPNPSV